MSLGECREQIQARPKYPLALIMATEPVAQHRSQVGLTLRQIEAISDDGGEVDHERLTQTDRCTPGGLRLPGSARLDQDPTQVTIGLGELATGLGDRGRLILEPR